MAQTTQYHCDHCGNLILMNRNLLKVEAGALRHQVPDGMVDLCKGCSEQFLNWLRERPEVISSCDSVTEVTEAPNALTIKTALTALGEHLQIPPSPMERLARKDRFDSK